MTTEYYPYRPLLKPKRRGFCLWGHQWLHRSRKECGKAFRLKKKLRMCSTCGEEQVLAVDFFCYD